ncbi:MAG: hypothetical protein KDJ62_11215 [Rhodobiaceae bacterium]|nr:hypothetical protein [Rhodobiaceae bacterium]MCC0048352.1 hypothetical protein [Rhodobiaceae bacterium]
MRNNVFPFLMVAWLAVFCWSFWVFFDTAPAGDGFVRGMNRVFGFLGWQAAATGLAIVIAMTGKRFERGSGARWLARIPAACAILLVLAVIAAIIIAVATAP